MAFNSKAVLISLASGVAAGFAFFSVLARLANRARQESALEDFLAKRQRVHERRAVEGQACSERAAAVLKAHLIRTGKLPKDDPKPEALAAPHPQAARSPPPSPDPKILELNRQAKESPERTASMIRNLVIGQDRAI